MAQSHDTMMNPPIEGLLSRVDSKFSLVTLAARRARNINSYFNQLGEGLGHMIPPQVSSVARKPLSIAFEEISADKIVWTEPPEPASDEAAPATGRTDLDHAHRPSRRPRREWRDRRLQGRRGVPPAGRRRSPCGAGDDGGRREVPGTGDVERARQRAGQDRPVRRARTDPAHQARAVGGPDRRGPGDGSGHLCVRPRAVDRPAHQHAVRDAGARRGLPGDALGDVGAPRGRRQHRDPAPARRPHRGARDRPPRRR